MGLVFRVMPKHSRAKRGGNVERQGTRGSVKTLERPRLRELTEGSRATVERGV